MKTLALRKATICSTKVLTILLIVVGITLTSCKRLVTEPPVAAKSSTPSNSPAAANVSNDPSPDFVESYTDQFGAQLKSEMSQPKISRVLSTEKMQWNLDMDRDDVVLFHNFYGYPEKTELSSNITRPLTFIDKYGDAELYYDGNGVLISLAFWSSRLSLPNGITIGSTLEQIKKYYPDGFFYPETSSSKEARAFHQRDYYFLRMSRFGGGSGIIFHLDDNNLVDRITYGATAFTE